MTALLALLTMLGGPQAADRVEQLTTPLPPHDVIETEQPSDAGDPTRVEQLPPDARAVKQPAAHAMPEDELDDSDRARAYRALFGASGRSADVGVDPGATTALDSDTIARIVIDLSASNAARNSPPPPPATQPGTVQPQATGPKR